MIKRKHFLSGMLFLATFTASMISFELFADDSVANATKTEHTSPIDSCEASTLECVLESPECSIFAKAIKESGLEEILKNASECTIFVPTNKAFENWTPNQLDALFNCQSALAALVLNHVCPKTLSPSDLVRHKKIMSCCNYDDCEKLCGKNVAMRCGELCPKMRKDAPKHYHQCDKEGKPCFDSGKLCHSVKKYPSAIIKCKNGYVYAIDQVQIPRGLLVYQELQSIQPEPALIIEEVSAIVEPDASTTNQETAKDAAAKESITPEATETGTESQTTPSQGSSAEKEK